MHALQGEVTYITGNLNYNRKFSPGEQKFSHYPTYSCRNFNPQIHLITYVDLEDMATITALAKNSPGNKKLFTTELFNWA